MDINKTDNLRVNQSNGSFSQEENSLMDLIAPHTNDNLKQEDSSVKIKNSEKTSSSKNKQKIKKEKEKDEDDETEKKEDPTDAKKNLNALQTESINNSIQSALTQEQEISVKTKQTSALVTKIEGKKPNMTEALGIMLKQKFNGKLDENSRSDKFNLKVTYEEEEGAELNSQDFNSELDFISLNSIDRKDDKDLESIPKLKRWDYSKSHKDGLFPEVGEQYSDYHFGQAMRSVYVKGQVERKLYIPFEPVLRPQILGQNSKMSRDIITSMAQQGEIQNFDGSVGEKIKEALLTKFKKIFQHSQEKNKDLVQSFELLEEPVLNLEDPVMRMVDYDEHYFFYITGNHYKSGKGRPYLLVYEYFLDPTMPLQRKLQLALSDKHCFQKLKNSNTVIVEGQYLVYLKIVHLKTFKDSRDPNSEIIRKIEQKVCAYDLVQQNETLLTNHIELAAWNSKIGIGSCIGGVFARDGIDNSNKGNATTIESLKKAIQYHILIVAYSFGEDELTSKLEYGIRSLQNFSKNIIYESNYYSAKQPNHRMKKQKMNQLDLILVRHVDYPKEDLSHDLLILQREDMNKITSNAVWIVHNGETEDIVLKEIRRPKIIKIIENHLEQSLLMPYYVHEFVNTQFQKKLVERKVENKNQYPFFGVCGIEVFSQIKKKYKFEGPLKVINIIHDPSSGQYIIFTMTPTRVHCKYINDSSFVQLKDFSLDILDPLSQAASNLIQCKQYSEGINNLWMTQNKRGNVKELHDVPLIHYLTENGDKQTFVANEQIQTGWNKNEFKQEICNIVPYKDNDSHKDQNTIRMVLQTTEYRTRPFVLRMVQETNGNLNLVLFNYRLEMKTSLGAGSKKVGKMVVNREKEVEGQKILLISDCMDHQFQYCNLCESSPVYKKNPGLSDLSHQNFQFISIDQNMMFVEIHEFEVHWNINNEGPAETQINLVGMKIILFKPNGLKPHAFFYPLFDENGHIIGTQFLPTSFDLRLSLFPDFNKNIQSTLKTEDMAFLQLKNFSLKEYQFSTDIGNAGFRKYYDKQIVSKDVLLLEVSLSERMRKGWNHLANCERFIVLKSQLKTLLNIIPVDIKSVFQNKKNYDFFQPLMIFNGQSLCDYYINKSPKTVKEYTAHCNSLKHDNNITKHSIVESFLQNLEYSQGMRDFLNKKELLRDNGEISHDFLFQNSIQRCFELEIPAIGTAEILIAQALKFTDSIARQHFIMSVSELFLNHKEQFQPLYQFYIDTDDNQSNHISYTVPLEDKRLPTYSDQDFELKAFQLSKIPIVSEISEEVGLQILSEQKDKQNGSIPIQHFLIDFTSYTIQKKLQRFRIILKKKVEDDIEEKDIMFTDLDLIEMQLKIVTKYKYELQRMPSLMSMIEAMYQQTRKIYFLMFLFFIFFYLLPFLVQIFILNDSKVGVTICNSLCLFTSFVFFILEYLQMQAVGMGKYLRKLGNWFELAMFPMMTAYFIVRLNYNTSLLVSEYTSVRSQEFANDPSFGITILANLNLLNSIMLFWSVVKVAFFLRVIDKFSLLIELIGQCFLDVTVFCILGLMCVSTFTAWYIILGMEINYEDYPSLGKFGAFFVHTFRLSIGDVSPPKSTFWQTQAKNGYNETMSNFMILAIWYFWAANQFLIVVVLLNFLIAIISNSYDQVMSNAQINKYNQMCLLNREVRLIMKTLGLLKKETIFILSARKDALANEFQQWQGFVQTIRSFISFENSKIKDKFTMELANATQLVQNDIQLINQKIESIINVTFNIKAAINQNRAETTFTNLKNKIQDHVQKLNSGERSQESEQIRRPTLAIQPSEKSQVPQKLEENLIRDPNSRFFRDLELKLNQVLYQIKESVNMIMGNKMDQVQQYVRMSISQSTESIKKLIDENIKKEITKQFDDVKFQIKTDVSSASKQIIEQLTKNNANNHSGSSPVETVNVESKPNTTEINEQDYSKLKQEIMGEMNQMRVVMDDKINSIKSDLNNGIKQILEQLNSGNTNSEVSKHELMEIKLSVAKMNKLQNLQNDMTQISIKNQNKKNEVMTREFGEIGDKLDDVLNQIQKNQVEQN